MSNLYVLTYTDYQELFKSRNASVNMLFIDILRLPNKKINIKIDILCSVRE